ncbi:Integral membrane protein TerC family protein [Pirellula sp. SH-Sr6A]|uniref:TerC family protein n=1 Tax=Pirellula sp. SH-Sr6A TaxID=1632865 RepID=UPI00078D5B2B|nr:TerC family protein [Pirellula sp. SH-Sr6A]AMV31422.1 Integral membrane protein TerC family protein [Pirellula sp. SH-Sr6A]
MTSLIPNIPDPFLLAAGVTSDGSLTGNIIALIALSAMEIVLGIDNLVFLSVLSSRLPKEQQKSARLIGLALAMGMRIGLLAFLFLILKLKDPFFTLDSLPLWEGAKQWLQANEEINGVSIKDLILIAGGLFLLWKSVKEIHHLVGGHHESHNAAAPPSYASVLIQVMVLDLVFSLDSVITAVGMADQLWVMISAVLLSVLIMMIFANSVAEFVEKNPTVKMLAVAFLVMIGAMLIADGSGTHVSKGYVYFAMLFSLSVEVLNLRAKYKAEEAALQKSYTEGEGY